MSVLCGLDVLQSRHSIGAGALCGAYCGAGVELFGVAEGSGAPPGVLKGMAEGAGVLNGIAERSGALIEFGERTDEPSAGVLGFCAESEFICRSP